MARLETSSCDDKKRIALFVSPQAVDGANCPLRTAIGGLLARGAVGVVAVDELHRVPLDGVLFMLLRLCRIEIFLFCTEANARECRYLSILGRVEDHYTKCA